MFTNELFVVASLNFKRTFLFRLKRTKIYNRTVQGKMVSYSDFIMDIYQKRTITRPNQNTEASKNLKVETGKST